MQRKLTAILSADVVGYSGLMEADESGTLERLKLNRTRISTRMSPFMAAAPSSSSVTARSSNSRA